MKRYIVYVYLYIPAAILISIIYFSFSKIYSLPIPSIKQFYSIEYLIKLFIFLNKCFAILAIIFIIILSFYWKGYKPRWIFPKQKYFAMYIRLRHPLAFLIGLFYYLFIHLYLDNYDTPSQNENSIQKVLSFFAICSSSLAMWSGPFIRACIRTFSKDFIDEYYRDIVSRIISDLKRHQVLLGYGKLGKCVQKELIGRKKSRLLRELILDPSDVKTFRELARDIVVVDRDERLFHKVFADPALEKIGIAKLVYDEIEYNEKNKGFKKTPKEVWIPAVIGDFIDESIIDNCALTRCEFFIDTMEGYEESIRISKFAHDHPEVNGIIMVSDSAQKKFLFPKHSGCGVFLSYPTQQRGISLGEVVYPAVIRWLKDDRFFVPPNVLIFTDDIRQTHYMIETLLEELKMGDQLKHYLGGRYFPYSGECVDLKIVICGEADEIKRRCNPKSPQTTSCGLDVREWVEIIERCAVAEYAWSGEKYYIKSKVMVEIPHLMTMEKIIPWLKPEIAVISHKNTTDILKVLHDWIIAVERYNSLENRVENKKIKLRYYPKIIVGYQGEEERDVRDWLQYYDTLCRDSDDKWQKYPSQSLDCMVDLNKDLKENIVAIAEAMSNKQKAS